MRRVGGKFSPRACGYREGQCLMVSCLFVEQNLPQVSRVREDGQHPLLLLSAHKESLASAFGPPEALGAHIS